MEATGGTKASTTAAATLTRAETGESALDIDTYTNQIFAKPGKKFFFLFNQNLRRTNVQLAELVSLLQVHIESNGHKLGTHIAFMTFEEVKQVLVDLASGIDWSSAVDTAEFEKRSVEFCRNKVLLETYYGSASVFLPQHMSLDLAAICGESGYIHSCGELLLLRNAEKTKIDKFEEAIEEAWQLVEGRARKDRILLIPYCHEDFSHADRLTPFIRHGLDDVKLHISKAYIEGYHLYDVIERTAANPDYPYVKVAPTKPEDTAEFLDSLPARKTYSVWIISDADADAESRFPGQKKFYVMYLQRYKNNNVYHVYDENKPGWASHTTLPHSLAGAMINLARPWLPAGEAVLADPFGGSGTVLFESQKITGLSFLSSDLAPISEIIVRDNADFFKLTAAELAAVRSELETFTNLDPDLSAPGASTRNDDSPTRRLRRSLQIIRKWYATSAGDFLQLSKAEVDKGFESLRSRHPVGSVNALAERLVLYVALRASVRGLSDFKRKTNTWVAFFQRELAELLDQIRRHIEWLPKDTVVPGSDERIQVGGSLYSAATTPIPPLLRTDLAGEVNLAVADVSQLANDTYDAVIADPPYGFNTVESKWEAADFVDKMIPALVKALKPRGGQLILAAPHISFSGRDIIPFVQSGYLSREIIRFCTQTNRECHTPAVVLPGALRALHPPYYWVAEKTLQRKILHFWIRAKE